MPLESYTSAAPSSGYAFDRAAAAAGPAFSASPAELGRRWPNGDLRRMVQMSAGAIERIAAAKRVLTAYKHTGSDAWVARPSLLTRLDHDLRGPPTEFTLWLLYMAVLATAALALTIVLLARARSVHNSRGGSV